MDILSRGLSASSEASGGNAGILLQSRAAQNVELDYARGHAAPSIPAFSVAYEASPSPEPTEWQSYIDQRVRNFVF